MRAGRGGSARQLHHMRSAWLNGKATPTGAGFCRFESYRRAHLMGLTQDRQREQAETDDSGKRSLAARQNQANQVTANAFTQAQNAIAKAMKSSKTEVAGEVAFA